MIQKAAVKDLPGYNNELAPGVQLEGPPWLKGSPHFIATQAQRVAAGGTYGMERQIAFHALRAAGYSESQAAQALQEVDTYFKALA